MLVASIGDSVNRGFTVFFAWVPALLGAIAVLIIGYFVAKLDREARLSRHPSRRPRPALCTPGPAATSSAR